MGEIKKDFSYTECLIMIKIVETDFGNPQYLTISKVAKEIDIKVSNQRFWNVMKYLEKIGIVQLIDTIGSSKIISIKQNKMDDLIFEQNVLNPIIKFYESQHTLIIP